MFVEVRRWVPHLSVLSTALVVAVLMYVGSIAFWVGRGSGFWQSVMVMTPFAFFVLFIVHVGLDHGSRYFPSDQIENRTMKKRCTFCSYAIGLIFMASTVFSFS